MHTLSQCFCGAYLMKATSSFNLNGGGGKKSKTMLQKQVKPFLNSEYPGMFLLRCQAYPWKWQLLLYFCHIFKKSIISVATKCTRVPFFSVPWNWRNRDQVHCKFLQKGSSLSLPSAECIYGSKSEQAVFGIPVWTKETFSWMLSCLFQAIVPF